jgi:hypothetical protein
MNTQLITVIGRLVVDVFHATIKTNADFGEIIPP